MGNKVWISIIVAFLGLILSHGLAFGQVVAPGYTYEYWTNRDGLPSNGISDVEALDNGYVWLTTYDGLVRFNGIVQQEEELFLTFNKSNSSGFSSNRLVSMKALSANEFFLLTERIGNTNNLIHYKKGKFTSFGEGQGLKDWVQVTAVGDDGSYWIVNDRKLLRFDNGEWIHEYPEISLQAYTWTRNQMEVIDRNNIWVLGNYQLLHIKNGTVKKYGEADGLPSDSVNYISRSKNGDILVAGKKGIGVIRQGNVEKLSLPSHPKKKITGIVKVDPTNSERIIIELENNEAYVFYKGKFQLVSFNMINPETGQLKQFELLGSEQDHEATDNWMFIFNKLFHNGKLVLQLDEGSFSFYSSNSKGGFWYSANEQLYRVRKSTFNYLNKEINGIENVYSLIKDSNEELWGTGLSGQIYRRHRNGSVSLFDEEFGIDDFRAYSVMEDRDKNMWFGLSDGILFWDRINDPVFKYHEIGFQARGLLEDKNGNIWFGGVFGVFSMDESGEITKHSLADPESDPSIRFIYEDREGTIWFGTNGQGLIYYDEDEEQLKTFEHNHKLSDNIFRSFYQDEQGIYWAGTEGSGLNRIEFQGSEVQITHYNQDSGFYGGVIHTIMEDAQQRFWMSCNEGIFWVSKKSLNDFAKGEADHVTSIIYDNTDGLPGIEANGGVQSSGFVAENGELWFPMVAGVSWVNPNSVQIGTDNLNTRIEELSTNDSTFTFLGKELSLPKDQRNLQIKYVGYNYDINPQNVRFRHKLEGYDRDWNLAGGRSEAFYTNVPAGEYSFLVESSVHGADWSRSPNGLAIHIAPYFYETRLFYALCVLGLSLIGYLFYKQRVHSLQIRERELSRKVDEQTHQLKEQAKRLLELDKAKSRFFANISHEFRTPLTLTIGPLEDIKKSNEPGISERIRKKTSLALRNSKRLLRLVNQILDISKIETGHMTAKVSEQDLIGFVQPVGQAFLGLAEKKKIHYTVNLPESPIWLWFDGDMMEKIIGNLLSNAFKFTPQKGHVTLEILEKEEQVITMVSDKGVGIPKEELTHVFERFYQTGESLSNIQVGTGIGLSLVKELVELHGGRISVESVIGRGTTFTIEFKKGKTHFNPDQIELANEQVDIPGRIGVDGGDELMEEESEEIGPVNEEGPCVLIIDDNAEIRSYIRDFISSKYQVLESDNGQSGLELTQKALPDVIICDVMMPIMDGYKFTEKLKDSDETDFIPVILLTAKAEQEDKLEGLGTGANDYIVKPFDVEEVLLKVENLIRSHKKIKAHLSAGSLKLNVETGSKEEEFLKAAVVVVEENIDNENFGVDGLASGLSVSRAVLYTKMKDAISKTPSEFIWDVRLEYAAELLRQNAGNITEIAYSVGFKSVAHFSRSFKKKFGVTPRAYLKEKAG